MKKSKLPPYCYRDRSRVAYRPYLGRKDGRPVFGKPVRLGPLDAPLSEIWKAYERLTQKNRDDLRWLLSEYNSSPQFRRLAPDTQKGYHEYFELICRKPLKGGKTFGDAPLKQFTKRTIRRFLDTAEFPIAANRHVQYMKAAWNWGLQRHENVPEPNPCLGVDLNPEVPRDRYVTHEEYALVREVALSMRVPYFAPAMELAYLCRARRSEVFSLSHDEVLEEGILLRRGKGSRGEITLWTPRLRAAVEACKAIHPEAPIALHKPRFLIHDKSGLAYTKNALDSAWRRIINKAMDVKRANLPLRESFTFHDLKAKGVTDSDRQNAGGHKSKKMEAVYDRLPQKVELDYG